MRILLAGGTGLIGRALAADLVASGHEVTVLSRQERPVGLPEGVRAAVWDARSAPPLADEIARADGVVHLAGANLSAGRWTKQRKTMIVKSRVDSGAALAQAIVASERCPRVFVQGSAVGYYGPRGDETVDELEPPGTDYLSRVVIQWEASSAPVTAAGVRRIVIRSGVVLSRSGGVLARMLPPFRLGVGGPAGGGRQWLSWIHLQDEVAAIRFLIDRDDASGVYNLCAPNAVTNAGFSRALGRALHRPAILPIPALALRLVYGEMASVVLCGQRAVPARLAALGFAFRFPELPPALTDVFA